METTMTMVRMILIEYEACMRVIILNSNDRKSR